MPRVRFLGGTATVTGSRFLVEHGGHSVLVDCGLFQGDRETRQRNWQDPYFASHPPDEVLLTHAHIDHTGYLPRLVGTHGFGGPVRATAATADLLGIMLPDSARIQEEQAAYANRKGYSRHHPALPLYTGEHARATVDLVRPAGYHSWVDIAVGRAMFTFAGHILGSAHIVVEAGGRRIVFSGDIGRWDVPVINDPEPPPRADLVVMESTYGGRSHGDAAADPDRALARAVEAIGRSRGVMIIPAFAVGRTQEILYRLRRLEEGSRIPTLPVFLDSPMAIDVTGVYRRHRDEHDLEMGGLVAAGGSPLRPALLRFTRTVEESKALNALEGPAIIISASGMATGGRVVHHLKRRLPDPRNVVLFVGYQAEGTRGRALADGASRVEIHGRRVPVEATVLRLDAFSAHADEDELVRWLRTAAAPPGRVALVHGEADARLALADRLRRDLGIEALLPKHGAVVSL